MQSHDKYILEFLVQTCMEFDERGSKLNSRSRGLFQAVTSDSLLGQFISASKSVLYMRAAPLKQDGGWILPTSPCCQYPESLPQAVKAFFFAFRVSFEYYVSPESCCAGDHGSVDLSGVSQRHL